MSASSTRVSTCSIATAVADRRASVENNAPSPDGCSAPEDADGCDELPSGVVARIATLPFSITCTASPGSLVSKMTSPRRNRGCRGTPRINCGSNSPSAARRPLTVPNLYVERVPANGLIATRVATGGRSRTSGDQPSAALYDRRRAAAITRTVGGPLTFSNSTTAPRSGRITASETGFVVVRGFAVDGEHRSDLTCRSTRLLGVRVDRTVLEMGTPRSGG